MLVVLLAMAFQTPPAAPLVNLRATLQQLVAELDQHRSTYGATPVLTGAKHQLRDWIESRLAGLGPGFDTRTFAASVHDELRRAGLLCDDCDSNVLGYVDDVRLTRAGDFLVVVTAMGVSCGYDESAYVYARPDDVLFEYTADGLAAGDPHTAVRHFRIAGGRATQVDPIAGRPHDFVLEWLDAPWEEARERSESASLEAAHAKIRRADHVGDFPEPTLRCTTGADLWQVATRLFEGPKRYYLVRWREPFSFTLAGVSETPYADCTLPDSRGDRYADLFRDNVR